MMGKRKVDKLHGIRIEIQDKERDLIETQIYLDFAAKIVDSLSKMKIETLYAYLTILEAFDLVDTPIPTISDASEIAAAFVAWAKNGSANREKIRKEQEEAAQNTVVTVPDADDYTPTGTDPRTSNYDENYDPTNPYHRYGMNPYTGQPL